VRLSDVADVIDSVQNVRAGGYLNGKRAVTSSSSASPAPTSSTRSTASRAAAGAQGVDPAGASTPPSCWTAPRPSAPRCTMSKHADDLDRAGHPRGLRLLRNGRATLIPAVAVPVSLIGTFAVMYLFGYSLDNLSLMALTISTGFVVDDAIVVMENITRHLEDGMDSVRRDAAGREGDRLHRLLHQHLADRRLHPAAADGRHRRPAVPRVRGHAVDRHRGLDGHLAHHHADDVRLPAEERTQPEARPHYMATERFFDWVLERSIGAACTGC
jgi:hypothetical protein